MAPYLSKHPGSGFLALGLVFALAVGFCAMRGAGAAELLGVTDEKPLQIKGKVVDIACNLTSQCPPHCGEGKRQLGLVTDQGVLYLVAKSSAIFAGAVTDLLPFCDQQIEIDGSTTTQFGATLLYVQRLRLVGSEAWLDSENFTKDWAKTNKLAPHDMKLAEWYRQDKTVAAAIKARGRLGVPE
ncbi:MAG: hypothetical protein ORN98_02220 [Alphaproteobacteria bacterium]|nr:hypothetical protein [Alphaproteobacteria bacterium]